MRGAGAKEGDKFTADTIAVMLHEVARTVHARCVEAPLREPLPQSINRAGYRVFVSAWTPRRLSCCGRITQYFSSQRRMLLDFRQIQNDGAGANTCEISKQMTVQIGPIKLRTERPKYWRKALRAAEKGRFNRKKADLPEDLPLEIRRQREEGLPYLPRTICVEPDKQTPDDVFFQLALILLQEQMVPETEINELNDQVVDYLRNQFWGCGDINTARLVLDKLRDHFVEPEYWLGLRRYVAQVLYREWRKEDPGGIVGKRGGGAEEDTPGVAVDVAVIQLKADGLPATRSTLYRWADQGEIDAVRDDDKDRLWLTPKGLAEARERLQWKALTTYQRDGMGKDSEAARKFTYRHQKRGDTPQDTASVLRVGRDGL